MKRIHYILLLMIIPFFGCERDITLDAPEHEPKIVVEGSITNGETPFVVLTRSRSFFEPTTIQDIENTFVHGATVTVHDGTDTVVLTEFASDTLPAALIQFIGDSLGIDIPTGGPGQITFYFYADASFTFFGQENKSYWLDVISGSEHLTAVTTIPVATPLDSMWTDPHPNPNVDTLLVLRGRYSDPPGEKNFIRYFTQTNSEPFYSPYFQSVADDRSFANFDGETFNFSFERGRNRNEDIDFETYTYWAPGDTVTVRWCAVDEPTYNFWFNLETDRNQTGGLFSRPIVIPTNINGGLGAWSGYAASYMTLYIPL